MFAVDGGFNRHKLAAGFPAPDGIDGFANHMRNGPADRPVDIKVQIAAELRAMRVAAAGSPQDDLDGLPDHPAPDDFAGEPAELVARILRSFSWSSIAPEVSADIKGV